MNEFVFNDYAGWLIENESLIRELKDRKTQIYDYYENIFVVVNHLYNLRVEGKDFDQDHYKIFSIGFHYLFDKLENLKLFIEKNYDGNVDELILYEKTILLFLTASEFQDDIYESIKEDAAIIAQPIKDIETEVYEYITNKEHAPESLYEKLDQTTLEIYNEHQQIYHPIYSIFYDIAEELNLI